MEVNADSFENAMISHLIFVFHVYTVILFALFETGALVFFRRVEKQSIYKL